MMAKTLSQKVAEEVLRKSFSYIPLKAGENPQDNPFLRERARSIQLRPIKTNSEEPAKPTTTDK